MPLKGILLVGPDVGINEVRKASYNLADSEKVISASK